MRADWHLEDLWLSLRDICPGISIEWLPTIDSTNTELSRRVRRGQTDPVLLVAEAQTAGRGRLGRAWLTPPGSALTFSLGLPLRPGLWSGLSLAVGVTLVEALDPEQTMGLGLKWPNDLWHWAPPEAPTKLGGILIETLPLPQPEDGRFLIVGVGINRLTPDIEVGAIAARGLDHWGQPPAPGHLLARLAVPLARMLPEFEQLGPRPWLARYATRDLLQGRALQTSQGMEGLGMGVDEQGALLLKTDEGVVRINSAEVSVRPLTIGPP